MYIKLIIKRAMDIKFYLKEYTWLIILLAVAISLIYPGFGYIFKPYVAYLLMVLMFLGCVNMDFKRSWKHLKKVRKVFWSMFIIHGLSALVVYLFRENFSQEVYLGLIIATTAPAGISVVFLSNLYGGSIYKSLVITFLSNMLSPVLLPLLVYLFASEIVQVDFLNMIWTIVKLVVIPVGLATLLRNTPVNRALSENGVYVSIFVLFFLVVGVISPVSHIVLEDVNLSVSLALFILLLVSINFGLGYLLGSDLKAKITYAISVSYKNFTLAMVIALTLFSPTVALPAAIYTVVNNLFLIPLQLIFVKGDKETKKT